jgi:hypothetical protein
MSHFTVLVIGDDVEEQLQPFHEYECTGIEDEHVMFVEQNMEEAKTEFEKRKENYDSFEEFMKEWYCAEKNEEGKWGTITNPNAKWDWWTIGGRWSGFLRRKAPLALGFELEGFTTAEVNNFINIYQKDKDKFMSVVSKYNGKRLEIVNAIEGMVKTIENEVEPVFENQLLMKEIDWEAMIKEGEKKGEKYWDDIMEAFDNEIPKDEIDWDEMWEKGSEYYELNLDKKREIYFGQPSQIRVEEAKKKNPDLFGFFGFDLKQFDCTKEEYIKRRGREAISTFAVVKDKTWYEKGKMGWWACVSDEKDSDEWNDIYENLIKNLDGETQITLVDCHI